MDVWIEHIMEPTRLILAWEAPKAFTDRKRWAVGEVMAGVKGATFRYYQGEEFLQANCNRPIADVLAAGYRGYPAFQPFDSKDVFRDRVLESFRRRLPPADRSDFGQYLQHFRLRPDTDLSPMALLAITGAKLPGDGFELVDTLSDTAAPFELVMQVAGYRHNYQNALHLQKGDAVELVAEPHNVHDPDAIAILADGQVIGHVNRLQAPAMGRLLREADITAVLLRLNGTVDVPKAFVFIKARSRSKQRAA